MEGDDFMTTENTKDTDGCAVTTMTVALADGCVRFYIHPAGRDGDTQNYELRGNQLQPDPRISQGS
jgi:hypothetical protein